MKNYNIEYKLGDIVEIISTNLDYEDEGRDVGLLAKVVSERDLLIEFDRPYSWTHDGTCSNWGVGKRRYYSKSEVAPANVENFVIGNSLKCVVFQNRIVNLSVI